MVFIDGFVEMLLRILNVHSISRLITQDYSFNSGACAIGGMITNRLLERSYDKQQL